MDFPLLQRLALPVTQDSVRYARIKIHDTRVIRLLEVLLHGPYLGRLRCPNKIHQAVLTTFQLSPEAYGLTQLRYDLRKLKGHALLATALTMPTGSLPKEFRSRFYSSFSTNGFAGL